MLKVPVLSVHAETRGCGATVERHDQPTSMRLMEACRSHLQAGTTHDPVRRALQDLLDEIQVPSERLPD